MHVLFDSIVGKGSKLAHSALCVLLSLSLVFSFTPVSDTAYADTSSSAGAAATQNDAAGATSSGATSAGATSASTSSATTDSTASATTDSTASATDAAAADSASASASGTAASSAGSSASTIDLEAASDAAELLTTNATTYALTTSTTGGSSAGTVALSASAAAAGTTVTVTATPASGYYTAQVRVAQGSSASDSLAYEAIAATSDGTYSFTMPAANVVVSVDFVSIVWDGTIDVTWYNTTDTTFALQYAAQFAGLAAIVDGIFNNYPTTRSGVISYSSYLSGMGATLDADGETILSSALYGEFTSETAVYDTQKTTLSDVTETTTRVIGDPSAIVATAPSYDDTVYTGIDDFYGKTVYVVEDLDFGATKLANGLWDSSSPNYMPVGGQFSMFTESTSANSNSLVDASFCGTIDGLGHSFSNVYCERYAVGAYEYAKAIGLIGRLGLDDDDEESARPVNPTVRQIVLESGYISGRRSTGGIVGKISQTSASMNFDGTTGGIVEYCINKASIRGTDKKGTGGIVGSAWNAGLIRGCANFGTVTNTGQLCPAGGIAGSNEVSIVDCYSVGTVSAYSDYYALAIGTNDSETASAVNCYYLSNSASAGGYYEYYTSPSSSVTAFEAGTLMAAALNASTATVWYDDTTEINGYEGYSYPVLYYQVEGYDTTAMRTVTLDAGVGSIVGQTTYAYTVGSDPQSITSTATPPLGYTFEGWTNGTSLIDTLAGDPGDITLTAVYEAIVYLIKVNYAGGSLPDGASIPDSYTIESETIVLPELVREGYTFAGWEDADGTIVTSIPAGSTGDITLTATWVEEDPGEEIDADVIIYTTDDLLDFISNSKSNKYSDKTVALAADLDMRGIDFTPIASSSSYPFAGTFDGYGHTISGISYGSGSYVGLFGYVSGATIKNLTVSGTSTSATNYVAGLVGKASGTLSCENVVVDVTISLSGSTVGGFVATAAAVCTFTNCTNKGDLSYSGSSASCYGGFVGASTAAITCTSCENYGNISMSSATAGRSGGFVGQISNSRAVTLTKCANYGSLNGGGYVGGLIGYPVGSASAPATILECANFGTVTASGLYAGGLIAYTYGAVTITDSYNAANVSATTNAGGIIGRGTTKAMSVAMTNVYVSGTATVTNETSGYAGILMGYCVVPTTLTNVYYLDGVGTSECGTVDSTASLTGSATAVSSASLASAAMVEALNGEEGTAWATDANSPLLNYGYPVLAWQTSTSSLVISAISYDTNGGVLPPDAVSTYVEGRGLEELPTPARTGYTFAGWVDADNNPVESISEDATGEICLYATWELIDYTVVVNINGGTLTSGDTGDGAGAAIIPATYTVEDAAITLPSPTREGYVFAGWVDDEGSSVTEIAGGAVGNITLNATWIAINYAISYELNGGAFDETTTVPYSYTTDVSTQLPTPVRDGYIFMGWSYDSSDNVITTIEAGTIGALTLSAVWAENLECTISYDLDGGCFAEDANAPTSYLVGTATSIPDPTRTGYEFTGWVDEDGESFAGITATTKGNLSLKATWSIITYYVTVNTNGGTLPVVEDPDASDEEVISADVVIYTVEDFMEFASDSATNSFSGKTVALAADIDLTDQEFSGIATSSGYAFAGTFDGYGHSITGMYVRSSEKYQGLFGYVKGTVKNLTVSGTVMGGSYSGGLVGYAMSGSSYEGIVSDVVITSHSETSLAVYGGLAGQADGATFANSAFTGSISVEGDCVYLGGIVGCMEAPLSSFTCCANLGTLTLTSSASPAYGGGIVGYAANTSLAITDCYNAGALSGFQYAAGAVGAVYATNSSRTFTVDGFYNSGELSASSGTGAGVAFVYLAYKKYTETNIYCLEGTSTGSVYDPYSSYTSNVVTVTAAELAAASMVATLNGEGGEDEDAESGTGTGTGAGSASASTNENAAWATDANSPLINNGFPVLSWQNPAEEEEVIGDGGIPKSYTVETEAFELPTPTRTGFVFTGWEDAEGNPVVQIAGGATGDIELNATWEAILYSISYNLDGGEFAEGETVPYSYTADTGTALPVPVRAGYVFLGWSDGTNVITSVEAGSTGSLELTALWRDELLYFIDCDLAGGQLAAGEEIPSTYKTGTALELPTPTRTGYEFTGWVDENGDPFEGITEDTVGNISITATWQIIDYSVTVNTNGGTLPVVENIEADVIIYTVDDFFDFVDDSAKSNFSGKTIALAADIDLSNEEFEGLFTYSRYAFAGTFDGYGHSITGLEISTYASNAALFYYVSGGTIKNLTLEGAVQGDNYSAGLVGYALSGTRIENVVVDVEVTCASSLGFQYFGGVVGQAQGVEFVDVAFMGAVSVTGDMVYAGGIAADTAMEECTFIRCANLGTIEQTSILGSVGSGGGIVGRAECTTTLIDCYNAGDITNYSYSGAAVGAAFPSPLTGTLTVSGFYNSGTLDGAYGAGVVVGRADFSDSYCIEDGVYCLTGSLVEEPSIEGGSYETSAVAVTAAELAAASMVSTLNGEEGTAWATDVNSPLLNKGYPVLSWQNPAAEVVGDGGIPSTYTVDDDTFELPEPTREGYTFAGWVDADGNSITEIAGGAVGNVELNATWEAIVYTVDVDLDGGEFVVETSYDEDVEADVVIYTAADLVSFAEDSQNNTFSGKTVALVADINLDGVEFSGISNTTTSTGFAGTFDGNGHTISGLSITSTDSYAGFFGYLSGTVKNLTVKGEIAGGRRVGSIAGYTASGAVIENVVANVDLSNAASAASIAYGGIVGFATGTTFTNVAYIGTILATGNSDVYIGGIAGYVSSEACTFTRCVNYGDLVQNNTTRKGYAGAIAGYVDITVTITDCYNAGDLSMIKYAGCIGRLNIPTAGDTATISGFYTSGIMDGTSGTGAGVGYAYIASGVYSDSRVYYLEDTSTETTYDAYTNYETSAAAVSADVLADSSMVATLNGEGEGADGANAGSAASTAWATDTCSPLLNQGYPVLAWQITYAEAAAAADEAASAYTIPSTYTIETALYELPVPVKEGYTFLYWKDGDGNIRTTIAGGETGNISLYAIWELTSYTLSFDAGQGSVSPSSIGYTINTGVSELPVPTRAGYTFQYWEDAEGTRVDSIEAGTTGDITLYAVWEVVTYTIAYDLAGGSLPEGAEIPSSYTVESSDIVLPTPERAGYVFTGWSDGTEIVTQIVSGSTGNVSLTATWAAISYILTLDAKGGVLDTSSITFTVEDEVAQLPEPTREGYTFAGWVDASGIEVTGVAVGTIGSFTVYAIWTANTYKVSLDANGGEVSTSVIEFTIESAAIELPTPTRAGYEFAGWSDGEGIVTEIAAGTVGDIALTATWETIEYTVTLDAKGGVLDTSSITFTVEDEVAQLPEPTREGYTFAGWIDADGATVTSVAVGTVGDVALSATWTAVEYAITVDLAKGELAEGVEIPSLYTIESETITLPEPTRVGYEFAGWSNGEGIVTEIATGTTGNVSLVATWSEPIEYTVTLDPGEGTLEQTEYSYTVESGLELPTPTREGYTFTGWVDEDGNAVEAIAAGETGDITLTATWAERVMRLAGTNRYNTMAAISAAAFPEGCDAVIVCRGDNFPDALSAAGLAGVIEGQVLLTKTTSLTEVTAEEIVRLGASTVYVIGDENSVSADVFASIEALDGVTNVTRVCGSNRYATAVEVYKAADASEWGDTCIVATGTSAADALSASAVAYAEDAPIFLANKNGEISSETLVAIANGGFKRVLVLGDENSVSAATEKTLASLSGVSVTRLEGSNRYKTSIAIAEWAFENANFTCANVAVTAGNNGKYADALAASALCGKAKSPVLLVNSTATSNAAVEEMLGANSGDVVTVFVLGDTASVTAKLYSAIEAAVE